MDQGSDSGYGFISQYDRKIGWCSIKHQTFHSFLFLDFHIHSFHFLLFVHFTCIVLIIFLLLIFFFADSWWSIIIRLIRYYIY